ncbi:MAG: hypothetical protein IKE52_02525 [Mogibacterium sp.]|nr:hypothetical protein [Mogibacterium sp.]
MDAIYKEKSEFVKKLNSALVMLPGIKDVEYRIFSDKYSEIMRVVWNDGSRDYINVTANSNEENLRELTRLITGNDPIGLIEYDRHRALIDKWFGTANQEEDSSEDRT